MSRRAFAVIVLLALALIVIGCAPAAPSTSAPPANTQAAAQPTTATATTASAVALQPCDAGALTVSQLQPSPPTTPALTIAPTVAPTLDPSAPTPTARPPTATPRPAPQTDRVGFPDGFQTQFKFLFVSDRVATKQVRLVCGNDIAASAKPGDALPFGSVLIFESWRPKEDAQGNVIKDANGHLIRDTLTTIFVMRKEKGFGEAYQGLRNGEWEYVAYRPDKTVATAPANTANCASCHLAANQTDFIIRTDLWRSKDHYGQSPQTGPNEVAAASVAFAPTTLTVKVGTSVKFSNGDDIDHNATASDGSFNSGTIKPNGSFSFAFNKAGTYNYVCSIHPEQMTAKIEVKE